MSINNAIITKKIPELDALSLEQKIGQMLMFGFQGKTMSDEFLTHVKKHHVGNVIVFSRNFDSAEELRALSEAFYQTFPAIPFIAIDQEGGSVTRIFNGANLLPGNMAVAQTGDLQFAEKYGRIIGSELRAMGVNLNLAPVLDINVRDNPGIGVRSFGETRDKVTNFGLRVLEGLQSESVLTTAKHFPGIGSAVVDSHFNMPVINKSLQEIESTDIPPFKAAIEAGVDCVMTCHTGYTAFSDSGGIVPATLSKTIMTDYLRTTLGFGGVIITDDLEMGGVEKNTPFRDIVLKSIEAGADILSICASVEKQNIAFETMLEAVSSNKITEARIDESVTRILSTKQKIFENKDLFFKDDLAVVVESNRRSAENITSASITIDDPKGLLPLKLNPKEKLLLVVPKLMESTPVEELKKVLEISQAEVKKQVKSFHDNVKISAYSLSSGEQETRRILELANEADIVLFCSYNAHLSENQSALLQRVWKASMRAILIMLRNPYDKDIFDTPQTSVALYAPLISNIIFGIRKIFRSD